MSDELGLLVALRTQGVASVERVAAALDQDHLDATSAALDDLVDRGLAARRSGRASGFTLTAKGAARLEELIADESLRTDEELEDVYRRFCALNRRVIELSSDWQVRRNGGAEIPNDHSDPDYDHEVIDRLIETHDRAKVFLKQLRSCAGRFAPYASRLDRCVERLLEGDPAAFTAPRAESYHTVWFELHEDLLVTLGRKRED